MNTENADKDKIYKHDQKKSAFIRARLRLNFSVWR